MQRPTSAQCRSTLCRSTQCRSTQCRQTQCRPTLSPVWLIGLAVCAFDPWALGQPAGTPAAPTPPTVTAPAGADTVQTEVTFGFWNVENLFDADDDPDNSGDDEYLPAQGWTQERYQTKLARLASVIAELNCHVLGLAEVENRRVLADLTAHEGLRALDYRIAHVDSPDKRGIDVALLYRAPLQLLGESAVILHPIPMDPATRGVLEVQLECAGHPLTVLVNHWPSRRGGVPATAPLRARAAETVQRLVRAAVERSKDRAADVLVLGDLNDDPFDDSVVRTLGAIRNRRAVLERTDRDAPYRLYNPMWRFYALPEAGTIYYNPEWNWNLFDQCIVSRGLLHEEGFLLLDDTLEIHGPAHLRDQYGRPRWFRKNQRTGEWSEGYSDHLPIRGRLRVQAGG